MRPPGRQSARAHYGGDAKIDRGAPGGGRDGRADHTDGPNGCEQRQPLDERHRSARPRLHPRQRTHPGRHFSVFATDWKRRSRAAFPMLLMRTCSGAKPRNPISTKRGDSPKASMPRYPGKMLAYNCSPSFNWKKHLDDATIADFQRELGAMGYKFQFITLAGFHALESCPCSTSREAIAIRYVCVLAIAGAGIPPGSRVGLRRSETPAVRGHGIFRRRDAGDLRRNVIGDGAAGVDGRRTVFEEAGGQGEADAAGGARKRAREIKVCSDPHGTPLEASRWLGGDVALFVVLIVAVVVGQTWLDWRDTQRASAAPALGKRRGARGNRGRVADRGDFARVVYLSGQGWAWASSLGLGVFLAAAWFSSVQHGDCRGRGAESGCGCCSSSSAS